MVGEFAHLALLVQRAVSCHTSNSNIEYLSLFRAAFIVRLIAKRVSSIPHIGSVLGAAGDQTAKYLKDKDHEIIRNKLEMISNFGDIIEQNDVARRVARRLADRYKEQLNRLHHENEKIDIGCCSWCKKRLPFVKPLDERKPAERVATFAVNYIISAVADESIKKLRLKEANNQDSLVEMLVELVCRAHGPKIDVPKCIHDDPNQYLPLAPKPITDLQTQQQQVLLTDNQNTTITTNVSTADSNTKTTSEMTQSVTERLHLYEFFRAPGLRYDPKEDFQTKNTEQQQKTIVTSVDEEKNNDIQSGDEWAEFPHMNTKLYGHRLCSLIELKLFKEEWNNMKQHTVCCTKCCC